MGVVCIRRWLQTEQWTRFRWRIAVLLALVSMSTTPLVAPLVHAQSASFSAYLVDGTCRDEGTPRSTSQVVATPYPGADDAPLSTFLTFDVELSLGDLTGAPHSLVIDAHGSGVATTIACGDIPNANVTDRLVVPLTSTEMEGLVGVAVLRPANEAPHVIVEMYLVLAENGAPVGTGGATTDDGDDAVVDDGDSPDAPDDDPEGGV
jgi:hypothetical protein